MAGTEQVLTVLETFLTERPDVPGVVVVGLTPDYPGGIEAAAGVATRGGELMTPAHTFRLASNTKTFTAAALLRLVEDGHLNLEAPIHRFFAPELVARLCVVSGVPYGHEISVRQLLNHTSGIYDWGADEDYGRAAVADPAHRWTPMEQVEFALSHGQPYGRPGEVCHYSDTGYVLASMLIEQVSGLPLAGAFRALLSFERLGLTSTWLETLEPEPLRAGPRVRQYHGHHDRSDVDASVDLYGGGGLVSSAHDLALFWRSLFAGELFARDETLATMLTTVPAAQRGEAGLGLFILPFAATQVWRHGGFWGTLAQHVPSHRVTLAICTNQHRVHTGPLYPRESDQYSDEPGVLELAERLLNALGVAGNF